MLIHKTPRGYVLEPESDREEMALDLVVQGLRREGFTCSSSSCSQANHSCSAGQILNTDGEEQ